MMKRVKRVLRAALDGAASFFDRGYARCARRSAKPLGLAPEAFVLSYLQGLFPIGRPNGRVDWESLDERAVIAADSVHVSKRLKTYLRKNTFEVRYNEQFAEVLARCADRQETWINRPLSEAYCELHEAGIAHSVEAYQDGGLVGGGFGLAIGRVFFLESMYCTVDHASKIAFVQLADRLVSQGFEWIDCQYLSEHWKRFGAQPVSRAELIRRTVAGLACGSRFEHLDETATDASSAVTADAPTVLTSLLPSIPPTLRFNG